FEYRENILFAPYIPHSLEYLAKIYKYLIQNVIEPELDADTFKNIIGNVIASTFSQLTTSGMEKEPLSVEGRKALLEQRAHEYRKFGQKLQDFSEDLRKYKPFKGTVISDSSD